ncbi:MAG: iron-sulfur cluster assembly protein, partial [Nitrosotalea sp.]
MSQAPQDLRRQIFDELTKVVDPEINVSIMELELIDNIDIAGSEVKIDLHLTSPFCPAIFGFKIA